MLLWNLCWPGVMLETSTGKRHREIISSLLLRPTEIFTEVAFDEVLFMQVLLPQEAIHLSLQVTWTIWSRVHSRRIPMPAMMVQGCWLSRWKKRPPFTPQSLQGLRVHPQVKWQKNPSHFNEMSVSAYLERAVQSNSVHRVEVTSCSGNKATAFSVQCAMPHSSVLL